MVFQERTYSVLIVSAFEKFSADVSALLPRTDYWPVQTAVGAASARRLLKDRPVDIVIINAPLKDDFGLRLALDICNESDSAVLILAKSDVFPEVAVKATAGGVLSLPKPTSPQILTQSLRDLCAVRERLRHVEQRQLSVEERIAEIRLVNRAKWLLIEQAHMTEPEAHRFIEKQAMDRRVEKREVAENIIRTYPTT